MACNWPHHFCPELGMTAEQALHLLAEKARIRYDPDDPINGGLNEIILGEILAAIEHAKWLGCHDLPGQCAAIKSAQDESDKGPAADWQSIIEELESLGDPGDLDDSGSGGNGSCDFTRLPRRVRRSIWTLADYMSLHYRWASRPAFRKRFCACLWEYVDEIHAARTSDGT